MQILIPTTADVDHSFAIKKMGFAVRLTSGPFLCCRRGGAQKVDRGRCLSLHHPSGWKDGSGDRGKQRHWEGDQQGSGAQRLVRRSKRAVYPFMISQRSSLVSRNRNVV